MNDGYIVNVGGGPNWDQSYAGVNLADPAAQICKSIKEGDFLTASANLGAASIDLLSYIDNPVKAIATSVVSWLLEHLWFLDWFLDHTVGDPVALENAANTLYDTARQLDEVAASQFNSFRDDVAAYRFGATQSSREFEKRVNPRGDELKTQSLQCLGFGDGLVLAGTIVSACRGIMRDLLAEFTWDVLIEAPFAVAAAPYTGGGSLTALLMNTLRRGAKTVKRLADHMKDMAEQLGGLFAKLKKLANLVDMPVRRPIALAAGKNILPAVAKGADSIVEPDELTAADNAKNPPPQPAPPPKPWYTSGTLDD